MRDQLAPTLTGELVVVEPFSLAHEEALYEAARPEEIWRWWPYNPASDREAFHAWLVGEPAPTPSANCCCFATPSSGSAAAGSNSTDELNERSRAALAAVPARLDGVLREVKWTPDDRWRSTAVYSVLADEWPQVERRLAARLTAQAET